MNTRTQYLLLIIGLVFGVFGVVYAGPFTNPTTSPGVNPYDMVPVNVGTVGQVKSGGLGISANAAHGGTDTPITTLATKRSPTGAGANQMIQNLFRVVGRTVFQGSIGVATPNDVVTWPTGSRNTGYALDVRSGIASNASIFTTLLQTPVTGSVFFRNLIAGVTAPTTEPVNEYPVCVKNGNNAQTGNLTRCAGGGGHTPSNTPTVTLTANPTSIMNAGITTLSWASTNVTKCYPIAGYGFSFAANKLDGSDTSGLLRSTETFTIICSGINGSVAVDSVIVPVYKPFILNDLECESPSDCIGPHGAPMEIAQKVESGNSGLLNVSCRWSWSAWAQDPSIIRTTSGGNSNWSGLSHATLSAPQTVSLTYNPNPLQAVQCSNFFVAGSCTPGNDSSTRSVDISMQCTGTYPDGTTHTRSDNEHLYWLAN